MNRPDEWSEKDSQDNSDATATHAAIARRTHVITGVVASYGDSSVSGLLQVKKGSTVVIEHYVHGADSLAMELKVDENQAVSAVLAASGAGGTLGKVNITGYTLG